MLAKNDCWARAAQIMLQILPKAQQLMARVFIVSQSGLK
ncbi:hypothetical protein PULV_a1660 [Pseudoalteromonas ulvae UL12]|nr:hypothetical protein [Pseudoalteromonas ulvae UL12]